MQARLTPWLTPLLAGLAFGCMGSGQLPPGAQKFHLNHLGYDQQAPKRAVVEANGVLGAFQVVTADSHEVKLEGQLSQVSGFAEWGGGPAFYVADFSELAEAGSYELRTGTGSSPAFIVADQLLFHATAKAVLGYFKSVRADEADAAIWAKDAAVGFLDKPGTHDVRGGWYDASGDVSKYLTHLSYANYMNPQQIPLVAWALAWVYDTAPALLSAQHMSSELQAEALWGADYLVRVQDPSGFFYSTVFDSWSGTPGARKIAAFSGMQGVLNANYQAAFREGGGLAIAALARASRWKKDSAYFSAAQYLEAARRGFSHLVAHNLEYVDDGKENIIDDYAALMAATELHATTSDSAYLDAARARASSLAGRLHASGYFIADGNSRAFWHASDAGLPLVALARYLEVETEPTLKAPVVAAMQSHLGYLVSVTRAVPNPYGLARQHTAATSSAFFMPHDNESGYWWQGENARLASISAASLLAGRVVAAVPGGRLGVSKELAELAVDQLDWILGKNPYDVCMLAGFGRSNPRPYAGDKRESGTRQGGIANGITSREQDGVGIQWDKSSGREAWRHWRWVEQWLPHAAWYLVAVTALGVGPQTTAHQATAAQARL